jgi:cytochrome oxidase Cu insertion factor (SCO1/SenC/PrrC family)
MPTKSTNSHGIGTIIRIAVVCVLTLCSPTWSVGDSHGTPAEDIRTLPLRDQYGVSTTLRSFDGRTLVVNFIFTNCAVACHTQVKSLKAVRAALSADTRARVQFLSVSIDPWRDTPDTLQQYARSMGIDDPDWRFATASPEHLAELTRVLSVKRASQGDGQIDHTLAVFLFNAKNRLIQRYDGAFDAARLVREIGDVVRLFDPAYQPASSIGPRQ